MYFVFTRYGIYVRIKQWRDKMRQQIKWLLLDDREDNIYILYV